MSGAVSVGSGRLTQPADLAATLADRVEQVFGRPEDSMSDVELRARALIPDYETIVWEADAASLECTHIGASAIRLLGYPLDFWTGKAGFWAEIIHPDDRDEALANCALCAGRARGHNFSYRAVSIDREVRRFFNVLRVIRGPKRLAIQMRGILFDVTDPADLLDETSPLHDIHVQQAVEAPEY